VRPTYQQSAAGPAVRMTSAIVPHSGRSTPAASLEAGVSISRTRTFRSGKGPSGISKRDCSGETKVGDCPLSRSYWIPGTCSNTSTRWLSGSRGGRWNRRVRRHRPDRSDSQRVGKVSRRATAPGASTGQHSHPPRKRMRCSVTEGILVRRSATSPAAATVDASRNDPATELLDSFGLWAGFHRVDPL